MGKTAVTAALGLLAAERGKRTLVCEVDSKGNLADFFETGPTAFEEREIQPNLWAMSMDTEASLKQYLQLQLKLGLVARIGPLARMFDFVATAAPGVKEIVTVGKICWEVRERHYDLVVVDAAPTGHIVGQLAAPQAINGLIQVGPVRQQTGWMLDILGDPKTTGVAIVTTPEEMPVNETIELQGRLAGRDQRRPGRGHRQPGPARAVRAGRGGGLRPALASPRSGSCSTRELGGSVDAAARRGPHGRDAAADPGRAPRAAAGRDRRRACRCCTCPTCSPGPTGCARPGSWPRPCPPSWASRRPPMAPDDAPA